MCVYEDRVDLHEKARVLLLPVNFLFQSQDSHATDSCHSYISFPYLSQQLLSSSIHSLSSVVAFDIDTFLCGENSFASVKKLLKLNFFYSICVCFACCLLLFFMSLCAFFVNMHNKDNNTTFFSSSLPPSISSLSLSLFFFNNNNNIKNDTLLQHSNTVSWFHHLKKISTLSLSLSLSLSNVENPSSSQFHSIAM